MKYAVTVCVMVLALLAGTAMAEDVVWVDGIPGCYEYTISDTNALLLVNTAVQLTVEKGDRANNAADIGKVGTDAGKAIYGRLMKVPDVAGVIITARQIGVTKYKYPIRDWSQTLPVVLQELNEVLCGEKGGE